MKGTMKRFETKTACTATIVSIGHDRMSCTIMLTFADTYRSALSLKDRNRARTVN